IGFDGDRQGRGGGRRGGARHDRPTRRGGAGGGGGGDYFPPLGYVRGKRAPPKGGELAVCHHARGAAPPRGSPHLDHVLLVVGFAIGENLDTHSDGQIRGLERGPFHPKRAVDGVNQEVAGVDRSLLLRQRLQGERR